MDFVNKIINIATERGISINKMCQEAGITAQTFQNWKNGSQPTLDKALKLIKYLDISADELFDISPKKQTIEDEPIHFTPIKDWNTKEKYILLGIDNIIKSDSIEEIHENAYLIKLLIEAENE